MRHRKVGRSGLRVSELGLGTLEWGRRVSESSAREHLIDFVEAGGNLVDTAASFNRGLGEEVLGSLIDEVIGRHEIILCSKSGLAYRGRERRVDTSRRAMLNTLDATLSRLNTDHLDLWLAEAWDPRVPLDETLSALEVALGTGRARYVGVSNFSGWQTALAAVSAPCQVAAASVEYSLVERNVEAEVCPAAAELGVGLLAWAPLGRGVLGGQYRNRVPVESRRASSVMSGYVEPVSSERHARVAEAVATAARGLDRSPAQVALGWVLSRPQVASAVVGVRTGAHLQEALAAVELEVPAEIAQALDEVSRPQVSYPADGTLPLHP